MITADKVSFTNQCQLGNLSSMAKVCLQERRQKIKIEEKKAALKKILKIYSSVFEASLAFNNFL